jgi:hypothetical protein
MTLTGPWYITASAIRDYLRIVGEEPVSGGEPYERAARELQAIAQATVDSPREPVETDSGALRYRGPKPLRLQLLVMPSHVEARLPQLVRVLPSHGGVRRDA